MSRSKKAPHPLFTGKTIRIAFVVVLVSILLAAAGCGSSGERSKILNVGVLLGSGGLGDKSFNDSAYSGLLEAQRKFNIRFETVNTVNKETDIKVLRSFVQNKYDLVIAIGFEHMETVQAVAQEFPQGRFAAIDFEAAGGNVASVVFREHEGDFLMGVLAAMMTRTKVVGVIGGADIPAIRRIISGFKQGVAYQDKTVTVWSDLAGSFSDPQAGLTLALSRYGQGTDIIHNAASKTGLGIIEAARQTGKLTTGTSGDQRYMAPGNVVGNRPKRVDTAVLTMVEAIKDGTFKSGVRSLGLKENGLSLGPFDEALVTRAMSDRLEDLRQKIVKGDIIVQAE